MVSVNRSRSDKITDSFSDNANCKLTKMPNIKQHVSLTIGKSRSFTIVSYENNLQDSSGLNESKVPILFRKL